MSDKATENNTHDQAEFDREISQPQGFHFAVPTALEELNAPVHRSPAHERFLHLCAATQLAYPGAVSNLTDAEILASPATPELMRYLVRALSNYAARTAGVDSSPSERRGILADAFGLVGNHGGSRKSLQSESQEMRALGTFTGAVEAEILDGIESNEAQLRAFQATYNATYGDDGQDGREKKQVDKNRRALASMLINHGYLK